MYFFSTKISRISLSIRLRAGNLWPEELLYLAHACKALAAFSGGGFSSSHFPMLLWGKEMVLAVL